MATGTPRRRAIPFTVTRFSRTGSPVTLKQTIRRALTGVAVFAQCVMVLAPAGEVHERGGVDRVIAAGISQPGGATISAERGQASAHNATTCPACIAQSLHASLQLTALLPRFVTSEAAAPAATHKPSPHLDRPSPHQPRAPPSFA